jgi:hypothetical protein
MRPRLSRYLLALTLAGLTASMTACGLLREPSSQSDPGSLPIQANPGEHLGTVPASGKEAPAVNPARSPQQAVERFAELYINWTYKSLASDQTRLAATAVGAARAAELQAEAQTARDTPLQRAHIYNAGRVIAVSRAVGAGPQEWVAVTRERTGGDAEYAGIQAAFHVSLATVQAIPGGWAVSAWRPQA